MTKKPPQQRGPFPGELQNAYLHDGHIRNRTEAQGATLSTCHWWDVSFMPWQRNPGLTVFRFPMAYRQNRFPRRAVTPG